MDEEARVRRRRLTLLLAPIVVLVVASNLGSAFFPTLAANHPLLLIALNSQNRHLVAVVNEVDPVAFYVVGSLRLLLSDPLFYLLGWWYGDGAISWMERKSPRIGEFLRQAEGLFGKAAYVLVFVAPNNYVCLFAGASRMPPAAFVAVNVAGTVARLTAIRIVGKAFASPLDALIDFLRRYQWQATAVTVALVLIQVIWDRRRGTSELESVGELERELEEEIEQAEGHTDRDQ